MTFLASLIVIRNKSIEIGFNAKTKIIYQNSILIWMTIKTITILNASLT